ncbi:23S rRNA pseudouridine1911/1915/1917 synthase [Paenibacillus sp. 1_12]|uniref:RluA family pseudouridine synthase n=1 Tax=Paenibacillus sp. 1_12 TaxID=1566278 RepID=UPI0008EE42EF|nr:RluA family pseudouridine synthase [Paenibacillus sp. 1_12]SFL13669.1 23S rRNA pseudouridine1911/1915/1917 synthase [Paenibacillus sp. 1_12]
MSSYYEPLTYTVSVEEDGFYLKTILQNRMYLSRKLLSRLKLTEQGILLNGQREYISVRVHTGDVIEVRMKQEESEDILPQELPIDILFEDEHLLIVNKASGMIVHPTHGHYVNTLANGVVHYWQQQGKSYRFRPIHRLDQETSGTLAIAKNPFVQQQVSEQMKANLVKKEYVALLYGVMEQDEGTVNAPIDRDPEQPHIRIVTESGYPAVTHYKVERRFKEVTLVRLWLETGRTHQIRVHMQHLGHPLIGDKLYKRQQDALTDAQTDAAIDMGETSTQDYSVTGSAFAEPLPSENDVGLVLERHALHAIKLGFNHPSTKQWIEFHAPLPLDLENYMTELQD